MPMLGIVCSKLRFLRQLVNCQFDYCLVLRAGLIETRNQKTRPPMDSFRGHEHNGDLRILKQASIRNHVFRDKPLVLIYVKLL